MIWILSIPFIIFFTFKDLIESKFSQCYHCDGKGFLGWCFLIFVGCFISFLISWVPIGIAAFIGSFPERTGIKDKEYPLISLRERDGTSGQFYFLGSGSINDVQYYFWYRRNSGGDISGGKTIRESDVRIYETDGSEAKMITFKTEYKNRDVWRWLWIFGIDLRDRADWCPDFYIPKGSIKEGYQL
jgi:hypothetical protein